MTAGPGDGAQSPCRAWESRLPERGGCPCGHRGLTDSFFHAADPLRILLQLVSPSPVRPVPASPLRKCPLRPAPPATLLLWQERHSPWRLTGDCSQCEGRAPRFPAMRGVTHLRPRAPQATPACRCPQRSSEHCCCRAEQPCGGLPGRRRRRLVPWVTSSSN